MVHDSAAIAAVYLTNVTAVFVASSLPLTNKDGAITVRTYCFLSFVSARLCRAIMEKNQVIRNWRKLVKTKNVCYDRVLLRDYILVTFDLGCWPCELLSRTVGYEKCLQLLNYRPTMFRYCLTT